MGLEKFTELLAKGKYRTAKLFADELVGKGIPESAINHRGYYVVEQLKQTNSRKAEKLTKIFGDYSWGCWLK
jgi:hypothetical protein